MANILVVDDEPDVRELFNITLKMAGHITDTAKDGKEAVGKLDGSLPDLILLDLMMPFMDGFQFLDHVRVQFKDKPLRVLVATAKVLEDSDHQKLNPWPVVGVLNKGELDIAQMVSIISTALSKSPLKANGDASAEAVAEKAPENETEKTEAKPSKSPPSPEVVAEMETIKFDDSDKAEILKRAEETRKKP